MAVLALSALAGAAFLLSRAGKDGGPDEERPVPPPRPEVRRRAGDTRPAAAEVPPGLVALDATSFARLPESHRPEALEPALKDMSTWLARHYPEARAEFLGVACEAPPCIVGLRYDAGGFREVEGLRAFLSEWRSEVESRVGWEMTSVSMDENAEGDQFVWMFGVPSELPAEEPLRDELMRGAAGRQSVRMGTAPSETPVPQEDQD